MAESKDSLKSSTLGSFGVAALGCVMMAPALGIYANLGLISSAAGNVAPSLFIVALLCILPTSLSFAFIAKELPSAGSAYTWLSEAINPFIGAWMGLLLLGMFFFAVILQPILFGLFFDELLLSIFHIPIGYTSWMVGVIVSTIIVALLVYPGINVSARVSVVLTIFEVVVVLALACTILSRSLTNTSIDYAPFNPAISGGSTHGLFGGLIFALLSFVGFGVIATTAEESHSPRTIIPRAMVLACVGLGIFWAFTSWGFCLVLPSHTWADYVGKGINPVAIVAQRFWGWGSIFVIITAITAVLGVYLAAVVGYARITFAMGRDGTLPTFTARLHPKYRNPWNAQHIVFISSLIVAAIWGRWLGLYLAYDWWGSVVVFFSMITYIFVNIGCGVFFYRFRRERASWLWHGVVPFLGILSSSLPLYYSFGPNLWRAGWKKGESIILFCLLVLVISALYALFLKVKKPEVINRIRYGGEI